MDNEKVYIKQNWNSYNYVKTNCGYNPELEVSFFIKWISKHIQKNIKKQVITKSVINAYSKWKPNKW